MGCCGSAEAPAANPKQVDASHFTFGKVVGKGGFGKVYAAMRLENEEEVVAIKKIAKRRLLREGRSLIESVWTERDVMSKVTGPYCVNLLHAYQDADDLFLVMPFLRGGDLDYYMEVHGPLTEDLARFYAAEIVLALEELHGLGYIYRDLKPQNVLFHEGGHIALSDFGLCVQLKEKYGWKTKGTSGTVGFQAPEVLSGEGYGFSCDFFSFGVTLYALLMKRYHLFGKNGDEFTHPISFRHMSPVAADIIQKLLTLNHRKRLGCTPLTSSWPEEKSHSPDSIPVTVTVATQVTQVQVPVVVQTQPVSVESPKHEQLIEIQPQPQPQLDVNVNTNVIASTDSGASINLDPNPNSSSPPVITTDSPSPSSDHLAPNPNTADSNTPNNTNNNPAAAVAAAHENNGDSPATASVTSPAVKDDTVSLNPNDIKIDVSLSPLSGSASTSDPTLVESNTVQISSSSPDKQQDQPQPQPQSQPQEQVQAAGSGSASEAKATNPNPNQPTDEAKAWGEDSPNPGQDKDNSNSNKQRSTTILLKDIKLPSTPPKTTGWQAVKEHPFFDGIDWAKLARREMEPPYRPQLKDNQVHCSNRHSLAEHFLLDEEQKPPPLSDQEQGMFKGFEFNVDVDQVSGAPKVKQLGSIPPATLHATIGSGHGNSPRKQSSVSGLNFNPASAPTALPAGGHKQQLNLPTSNGNGSGSSPSNRA